MTMENNPSIEEIENAIPDERKHHNGLLDAMDRFDKENHRRGLHGDEPRECCPLCEYHEIG